MTHDSPQPSVDRHATVELEFTDKQLLRYMIAAHEADMSFNQFVNAVVREFLENEQCLNHDTHE